MFWKLLAGQLVVVALLVVGSLVWFLPFLDRHLVHEQQLLLEDQADLLAQLVDPGSPADLSLDRNIDAEFLMFTTPVPVERWVRPMVRRSGSLLTVTRPVVRGEMVLGEWSVRRSLDSVESMMARIRSVIAGILILGSLFSLVMAYGMSRQWTRRLKNIGVKLEEWPLGLKTATVPMTKSIGDELSVLAQSIDQTRDQLAARVRGIDQVRRDLQSMLETIPEAVIAIDSDQRVLFANPSTYRLFDLPPHDISGQKLWAILRQPGLQDAVSMTFASRDQTSTEFEIRHPPRVLSFRGRSLTVGSGKGIIIVLHDVTELRRLERMRQDFFSSVSHELKTPLASIKAYTETLLDDGDQDREVRHRFLHRIDEQAERLHALVIDMLMLARVESEDHGFDIQPIDLNATVSSNIDLFREKAEAKQVEIETEWADEPTAVVGDAEGLGMIVRNLVDNAVKYTPQGGKVTVKTIRQDGHLVIQVADTGVGIPTDDLTRIFERFYRVDKARSRELGGTGLGLSIVKHLVQRFGGTVSVRSRLHEGSVFSVTLPASPNQAVTTSGRDVMEQEAGR